VGLVELSVPLGGARGSPGTDSPGARFAILGFARSRILALAFQASLEYEAGSFGPGFPSLKVEGRPVRRSRGGLRPGVGKRDGATGRGGVRCKRDGSTGVGGQAGRVHEPRSGLGEAEVPLAPADPSRL
jgi:hypothetical protein